MIECKHIFKEFWKITWWGRSKIKQFKCIVCGKVKEI